MLEECVDDFLRYGMVLKRVNWVGRNVKVVGGVYKGVVGWRTWCMFGVRCRCDPSSGQRFPCAWVTRMASSPSKLDVVHLGKVSLVALDCAMGQVAICCMSYVFGRLFIYFISGARCRWVPHFAQDRDSLMERVGSAMSVLHALRVGSCVSLVDSFRFGSNNQKPMCFCPQAFRVFYYRHRYAAVLLHPSADSVNQIDSNEMIVDTKFNWVEVSGSLKYQTWGHCLLLYYISWHMHTCTPR